MENNRAGEQFHQSIVQRGRKFLQVQPDVKGRGRRNLDVQIHLTEPLENMVTLDLEVLLESNLHPS